MLERWQCCNRSNFPILRRCRIWWLSRSAGTQQWWCLGETQGEEEQKRTNVVTLNTVSGKGVPTGMPCRSSEDSDGSQAGPWERAFLDGGTLDAVTLENLRSSRRSHFGDGVGAPESQWDSDVHCFSDQP